MCSRLPLSIIVCLSLQIVPRHLPGNSKSNLLHYSLLVCNQLKPLVTSEAFQMVGISFKSGYQDHFHKGSQSNFTKIYKEVPFHVTLCQHTFAFCMASFAQYCIRFLKGTPKIRKPLRNMSEITGKMSWWSAYRVPPFEEPWSIIHILALEDYLKFLYCLN